MKELIIFNEEAKRVLALIENEELVEKYEENENDKSISKVIVIPMIQDLSYPIQVATMLRENGVNTEIYLEDKAMKKKMNYANKQNIPYAIIIGEDEVQNKTVTIKNMITGEQEIQELNQLKLF